LTDNKGHLTLAAREPKKCYSPSVTLQSSIGKRRKTGGSWVRS